MAQANVERRRQGGLSHSCQAECVNADLRNRGLQRLPLRGRDKVRAVLLWFAVAHNLMRAVALRAAAKAAAHGRSVPQACLATA